MWLGRLVASLGQFASASALQSAVAGLKPGQQLNLLPLLPVLPSQSLLVQELSEA